MSKPERRLYSILLYSMICKTLVACSLLFQYTVRGYLPWDIRGNRRCSAISGLQNINKEIARCPRSRQLSSTIQLHSLVNNEAEDNNNQNKENEFASSVDKSYSSSSSNGSNKDDTFIDDMNLSKNKTEATSSTVASVLKKIRVAKAQAEIDRILAGPDPPFDIEREMERVISISPPSTSTTEQVGVASDVSEAGDAGDDENNIISLEKKIANLEEDLYQAVKEQDYAKASEFSTEISNQYIDDCGIVLQVNSAFYKAFSNKSYNEMKSLWLKDNTCVCIHPSHKPLIGSKAILNSWERMFASTDHSFQKNWMEPKNIRLTIKGATTAIITCDEHVFARRFVRGKKRQTELINKLTATNIFRKVGNKWYLCHHHASWHADSERAKIALRGGVGTVQSDAMTVRSKADLPDDANSDDDGEIGIDSILGMKDFGPILGSSSSSELSPSNPPQVQRVIMGSLSDILNGSLGDLLSRDDAAAKGKMDDNAQSIGPIIHFSSMDDDDDDDIDEIIHLDDDGDNDDDNHGEAVSIIKQWASKSSNSNSGTKNSRTGSKHSDSNDEKRNAENMSSIESTSSPASSIAASNSSNSIRQNCIKAIRKLCNQGLISQKQKSTLLTDIITSSAKGEYSVVEVAYDLLCGSEAISIHDKNDGTDDSSDPNHIAEEEFADQCRTFASFLSSPEPST